MIVRRAVAFLVVVLAGVAVGRAAETETLDLGNQVSLEIVRVQAGVFTMGSPEGEAGRRADEASHEVRVGNDFFLGKTPVTRGQFARFVADARYRSEAEVGNSGGFGVVDGKLVQKKEFTWKNPGFAQTDEHPVVLVTLKDAQAFCAWVGKKANRKVALPSEEQWEYACRAGTATRFYSGDADADGQAIAWTKENADGTTHEVGKKDANAWGLCDMSGNVFEWCATVYGPYRAGDAVQGDMDKARNVLRGGSFLRSLSEVRSAARYRNTAGSRNADNGFRILVEPKAAPMLEAPIAPQAAVAPQEMGAPQADVTVREETSAPAAAVPRQPVAVAFPRSASATTGSFSIPTFACFVPVAAVVVIAIVVYRLIRSSGSSSVSRPVGGAGPMPRLGDDGFWVDSSYYQPGQVVSYTYETPDGPVRAEFVAQRVGGQGQFIYTGLRPLNLILGSHLAGQMMSRPLVSRPVQQQRPPSRSESTFSGFPSAY